MKTRCFFPALILLFVFKFYLICFAGNEPFKYTLYHNDLAHSSMIRISEIVSLISEWQVYSIEGYTWQGIANGLDTYQQQNWIVMINNQKMALKVFDTQNLSLIPFSTDHIDSIEVILYPQSVGGEFSDKGLIHFHTGKTDSGLTVFGQFTGGNKTGDPGPYRYTDYWSSNVDRIAADDSYGLSYSGKFGYIDAGYYTQIYYPTDPRIVDRNRDIYPYENPRIITNSFYVRSQISQMISHPQISALHTELEDFYFFKPLGREIPVRNNFSSIQMSGTITLNERAEIGYKLRYSRNDFVKRKNKYNLDFDWKQQNIFANINTLLYLNRQKINFGLSFDEILVRTDYSLTKNRIISYNLYGSVTFNPEGSQSVNVNGNVDIDNEETGYLFSVLSKYSFSKRHTLCSTLAYSRTKIRAENTLWYWSEKGYNFVKEYGSGYFLDDKLQPGKQWSMNLIWQWNNTGNMSMNTGISYRSFLDKNWEIQPFQYNMELKTVSAPVYIKTGQNGQTGSVSFKIIYDFSALFSYYFYYCYTTDLGGSAVFVNIYKSLPKHRFTSRFIIKPVDTFSIWLMFDYRSAVFWSDFKDLHAQSNGAYSAELSDVFLTDIAVNKWLWKKQIKLKLVIRNVFNQKDISYPIGSLQNLRFYAQAELFFNF